MFTKTLISLKTKKCFLRNFKVKNRQEPKMEKHKS